MATTTITLRLAAILAADVVGYSRLMAADEEGTQERFKAHLVGLVNPTIPEHRLFVSPDWDCAFCCNRAPTRRSASLKRRAAPFMPNRAYAAASPPRMPSETKPNAPPPSSPKPAGLAAEISFRASPA
jgi:hypothetical protein